MAKLSLDPYNMELMKRGIGSAPMTRKEAIIESGKGVDPSSVADNPITYMDDLKRFGINLQNILKAGGLSQANLPATPQGIEAAVKKVTEAGGVKEGKTPDDFVPFDPTTLPNVKIFESTPGPEGKKLVEDLSNSALGSKVIPSDLAGGRGTIVEKPGDRTRAQRAEEFRKTEADLTEMQGGLKSQPIEGQGQDNNPNADAAVTAFMAGMDEFINAARGAAPYAPPVKDIEDYKRVFAEATGLDISGKPDKSSALMALGLALMQNRAGSGFNVGNILRAVGQAGEVALPKLEAAKKEAKANAAAAGKFALEMRSADQAKATAAQEKAMEREDYFIIPNQGGGMSGDIAGILSNEGRLEKLSKYELNRLMNDKEFSSKFTILPGSTYANVLEETMKTPEAKELYDTKSPRKIELFGEGANDMFTIETWRALPNSGKENILVGSGTDAYKALSEAARDVNRAKEKFITGMGLAEGVNIFRFGVDKLDQLASTLGFNMREGLPPTQQLRFILDKLQAQNAPEILGEAGKTISDADRQRVAQIVGDLNAGSTADEITFKLNDLFNEIILKKEIQIMDALSTLDRYTGRNVASLVNPQGELSAEDEAERIAGLKALGIDLDG